MDIARTCFRFLFPLVTLFFANHALAEIYKCPQPDGLVKFSDRICADGKNEPVVLLENSPLDNTAERENIARYNQRRSQHKSSRKKLQVVLIEDASTSERNARITAKEHPKKKSKGKTKKRRKQMTTKKQQVAARETTH